MSKPKPIDAAPPPVATPTPAAIAAEGSTVTTPRRMTRIATLQALLAQPEGTRLDALCTATGWQKHSVRAALSGLRKTGVIVERYGAEGPGGPLYRIVTGVATATGAVTNTDHERGTVE
jgi:Protein of unknown function (DUF3489).